MFLLVMATTVAARAESFDGIFVNSDGGNVAYFNLLRHGERITGDYTVVVRNPESSGGLQRSHFSVTGNTDRHGALLTIVGETPEAQAAMSYRWLSRSEGDGFSLEIPVATGRIATPLFRRSSVADVNGKLSAFNAAVDRELHVRLDKLAMERAEESLHADLTARLRALSAVVKASADLDRARSRREALEATVADLQRESERKHRLAGGADAAQLERTRRESMADLQDQANYTDYALAAARSDVLGASSEVASASQTLALAKRNLNEDDTRIASLLAFLVRSSAAVQTAH
jgi:hypothetical protein